MRPLYVLSTLCHFSLHTNLFISLLIVVVVFLVVNSVSIVVDVAFVSVSLRLLHINCFGILCGTYSWLSWLSCSAGLLLRGLILLFPATMRRFPVAQAHYCRRQFVTVLCLMTSFRMKNRGCIQCGRGGVKGGARWRP